MKLKRGWQRCRVCDDVLIADGTEEKDFATVCDFCEGEELDHAEEAQEA